MVYEFLIQYFNEDEIKSFSDNVNKYWSDIRNFEIHVQERFLQEVKIDIFYILKRGFLWINTPEGYDYWNDIYNKIHYGTWQKKS